MTKFIKLPLFALIGALTFAGAAPAQDVHIVTLGKSPGQIHAEIALAARTVCREESDSSLPGALSDRLQCVAATQAKAEADYIRLTSMQLALAGAR